MTLFCGVHLDSGSQIFLAQKFPTELPSGHPHVCDGQLLSLGHGFVRTYWTPSLSQSTRVQGISACEVRAKFVALEKTKDMNI